MENKKRKGKPAAVVYLLAWFVPGAGYWYSGSRMKGASLFVLIVGLFVCGLAMKGGVFIQAQDFISLLCKIARAGIGFPWLITLFTGLRMGDMLSPFGEIGACYTTVAGLLNLLLVFKTGDLLKEKKWL